MTTERQSKLQDLAKDLVQQAQEKPLETQLQRVLDSAVQELTGKK